jgi:transposase
VDPTRYRQRNVVERAIARLKQHRAIATRYDTQSMMAAVRIGSLV